MGTVSKTLTVNFSSYDNAQYYNVNSSYPLSNAYAASSNTTYTQIRWTRNSGAETHIYYRFNLSSIPDSATITSVTVKSKAYVNTTTASRVTTRTMQMATGTTLKGSTLTIGSSATEQTFSQTGVTWTVAELKQSGVFFKIVRGTSNVTSNYNLQIYGGTITVNYTVPAYDVTVTNNTTYTFSALPSIVESGMSYSITASGLSDTPANMGLLVTVNSTDVTNNFVGSGGVYSCTITNVTADQSVVVNYAQALYINIGSSETSVGYTAYSGDEDFGTCTYNYKTVFDSLQVGDIVHLTGRIGWYSSGLTYRDSVVVDDTFTWAASNTRTYNQGTYVYTITLPSSADRTLPTNTISPKPSAWSAPSFNFTIYKLDGSPWLKISKAYKKVSGSWVEQQDVTTVFDSTKHYKKGN